jgi:hypothetical protein
LKIWYCFGTSLCINVRNFFMFFFNKYYIKDLIKEFLIKSQEDFLSNSHIIYLRLVCY